MYAVTTLRLSYLARPIVNELMWFEEVICSDGHLGSEKHLGYRHLVHFLRLHVQRSPFRWHTTGVMTADALPLTLLRALRFISA